MEASLRARRASLQSVAQIVAGCAGIPLPHAQLRVRRRAPLLRHVRRAVLHHKVRRVRPLREVWDRRALLDLRHPMVVVGHRVLNQAIDLPLSLLPAQAAGLHRSVAQGHRPSPARGPHPEAALFLVVAHPPSVVRGRHREVAPFPVLVPAVFHLQGAARSLLPAQAAGLHRSVARGHRPFPVPDPHREVVPFPALDRAVAPRRAAAHSHRHVLLQEVDLNLRSQVRHLVPSLLFRRVRVPRPPPLDHHRAVAHVLRLSLVLGRAAAPHPEVVPARVQPHQHALSLRLASRPLVVTLHLPMPIAVEAS